MDRPRYRAIDERVQESATAAYTPTMGDGSMGDNTPDPADDDDDVFRVNVTSKYAVRVGPGGTPGQADMAFAMESYELMLVENAEVGSIVGMPVRATGAPSSIMYDLNATETDDDNYFMIGPYGQIRVKGIVFRLGRAGIIYPMVDDSLSMDDPDYPYGNYARLWKTRSWTSREQRLQAGGYSHGRRRPQAKGKGRCDHQAHGPEREALLRQGIPGRRGRDNRVCEARVNRVVPLAATEPDGGSIRWEVEGTDAADFEIMDAEDIPGDGKDRVELHFKSQPNYEKPTARGKAANASRDERNQYSLMVRAVEMTAVGGGPNVAAELPVTVQVTNSNEPGEVEVKWLQPEVNTPLPATLMDTDGNHNAMLPIVMAKGDTMIALVISPVGSGTGPRTSIPTSIRRLIRWMEQLPTGKRSPVLETPPRLLMSLKEQTWAGSCW